MLLGYLPINISEIEVVLVFLHKYQKTFKDMHSTLNGNQINVENKALPRNLKNSLVPDFIASFVDSFIFPTPRSLLC